VSGPSWPRRARRVPRQGQRLGLGQARRPVLLVEPRLGLVGIVGQLGLERLGLVGRLRLVGLERLGNLRVGALGLQRLGLVGKRQLRLGLVGQRQLGLGLIGQQRVGLGLGLR
jgi:hypothetical protein